MENDDYARFARRVIAAHGRRVAAGDPDALRALRDLDACVSDALATAVTGLRAAGYSWADIATRTGTTRQAAHARWATTSTTPTTSTTTPSRTATAKAGELR